MRHGKHLWKIGGVALAAAAVLVAYRAGRARAGVPSTDPLVYTGLLEVDGKPVSGSRSIGVAVFSEASGGDPLAGCEGAASDREVTAGHFAVPLSKACVDAIEAADPAELWVGVEVDGAELSPRAKIAAVPFALQARQAGGLTEKARADLAYPDCPPGYMKSAASPPGKVWCAKGADEVVRVGVGATAFWIDRYEASVWSEPDGSGAAYFTSDTATIDAPPGFPPSGYVAGGFNLEAYAVSKAGAAPARQVTWFQAEQLCRGVGKRLPTNTEWLAAVQGTPDPAMESDGDASPACHTCDKDDAATCAAGTPRSTGIAQSAAANACVSRWGAEDMIGNLWEWTESWNLHTQVGALDPAPPWPSPDFGADGSYDVFTTADNGAAELTGVPAALLRGGSWHNGTKAGAFAISLQHGASSKGLSIGFRCSIPR